MSIDMNALEKGIEILGLGWGGIFVVMIIIYLVSLGLCKLFPPRKDD
ncbi:MULTISPECIES: OadG-related small transporter subunit [unclassified Collinsella]|nr:MULTISPECIES: OadG-related small transporter subunit [unclassified Collinsella]